jgi:hypothetical protein
MAGRPEKAEPVFGSYHLGREGEIQNPQAGVGEM